MSVAKSILIDMNELIVVDGETIISDFSLNVKILTTN